MPCRCALWVSVSVYVWHLRRKEFSLIARYDWCHREPPCQFYCATCKRYIYAVYHPTRVTTRAREAAMAHPQPASSQAHLEPRHPSDQVAYQAPLAVALGVAGPSAWQPPPVPPSVTNQAEELEEVESTAAKRAKTRPTCPTCRGSNVKTLGGGTRGKYRYACQSCSANWQQVPPHRLEASAPSEVDSVGLAIRKRTINAPYKCHRCGQPKKGHICGEAGAGVGEAHDTAGAAHDTEVSANPVPRHEAVVHTPYPPQILPPPPMARMPPYVMGELS